MLIKESTRLTLASIFIHLLSSHIHFVLMNLLLLLLYCIFQGDPNFQYWHKYIYANIYLTLIKDFLIYQIKAYNFFFKVSPYTF